MELRGKPGVLALGLLVLVVTFSVLAVGARPAHAAPTTFTVNSASDTDDGSCSSVLVPARGIECTLREAINAANSNGNPAEMDRVHFNIPGTGVRTIRPISQLPAIITPMAIDGYTQPGASVNTLTKGTNAVLLIELSGTNAGNANGLFLSSNINTGTNSEGSVVRGLVINSFQRIGITAGPNITIEGNFIGTDPSGTEDLGNSFSGVGIGEGGTVGGNTPDKRNLISGNGSSGGVGVSTNVKVQGNLIGTKKDGRTALGNGFTGVRVGGANNLIGGATSAAANTIAFNEGDGISVAGDADETFANRVLRNSTFANADLGIDLVGNDGPDGPTANDPGDPDIGPNGLQNKPALTSATTSGGTTTIEGRLNSKPNKTFTIQFYSNPSGNAGEVFRGQASVTTNDKGNVAISFSPATAVPEGQTITGTATGVEGTSEFSAPRAVTAP